MTRYLVEYDPPEYAFGEWVRYADAQAAIAAAVVEAETRVHERWADALSKNAGMHVVMAVTRALNARGAA